MKKMIKIAIIASIMLVIHLSLSNAKYAEAGFFDRAKDIYNIPDRLEGLQEEYEATKLMLESQLEQQRIQFESQLIEQREQLAESQKQADELMKRQEELQQSNEYFRQQNEQYREQAKMLAAENENLLLKLEQIEQERKSFFYKLTITIGSIIGLMLLYACSVRIWRFIVWRKQKSNRSVMLP